MKLAGGWRRRPCPHRAAPRLRSRRRPLLEALARRDTPFTLVHAALAADAGSAGGYDDDIATLPMPPLFNWYSRYSSLPAWRGVEVEEVSLDPAAHDFVVHKAGGFKPMVKTQGATQKSEKKLKPNDPCHCGSGKKLKKCCGGAA